MGLKNLVNERDQLVQLRTTAEEDEDLPQLEDLDEQIDAVDEQIRDFVLEYVDVIEGSFAAVMMLDTVIDATYGHDDDGNRDPDMDAEESGADIVDRLAALEDDLDFDTLVESVRPLVTEETDDEETDDEEAVDEETDDEDSGED